MNLDKKKIILVIDDDLVMLHHISDVLSLHYDVRLHKSGRQAIEFLRGQECPDLILLDIEMPDIDGYTTIEQIHKIPACAEIPIIFLTALQDTKEEVKGLKIGAVDYVKKPFVKEVLLSRIERHIANGRKRMNPIGEEESLTAVLDKIVLEQANQRLSAAERSVAKYIIIGYQNNEIAKEMNLSEGYIRNIAHRIYMKLNISKRSELREMVIRRQK